MKKNNSKLISLLISLIVIIGMNYMLVGSSQKSWRTLERENINLSTELTETQKEIKLLRKYNKFADAIIKVGRREWSNDNNCYQHSQDLGQALADLDIMSIIIVNKDRSHAWLCPWIETVGGDFIGMKNNYNILEIRDKDRNMLCECK